MPWTFSYPVPIWRSSGGYSTSGGTVSTGGNGATATATVSSGSVTAIAVSTGGIGYTLPPIVTISGGGGTGATATATLANGVITGFTVVSGGTGYTTAPTVSISPVLIGVGTGNGPDILITSSFGPAPVQLTASYTLGNATTFNITSVLAVNINPSGVPSRAIAGVPSITLNPLITPAGILDTPVIGASIVEPGLDVFAIGVINRSTIGVPSFSLNPVISPAGVASRAVVGVSAVGVGAVSVTPAGVVNRSIIGVTVVAAQVAYEAETDALLARFGGSYNTAEKDKINDFIKGLKDDGLWSTIDCLQVYKNAKNSTDALLNWKSTSFTGTTSGSPTFATASGFTTNGSSSYIDTGISVDGGSNYVRNSATAGVWCATDAADNGYAMGGASSFNLTGIVPRDPFDGGVGAINQWTGIGGSFIEGAVTNGSGMFVVTRTSATACSMSRNTSTVSSEADDSVALFTANIYVGCRNFGGSASDYRSGDYWLFVMASGWTNTQRDDFYDRANTYFA